MIVLYVVVALAVVFGIAAVVVGREARRLDAAPPQATFDVEEATEWVANHLPFDVSAVLSYDDVRAILEWNLDFLRAKGLSAEDGRVAGRDHRVVVDRDEAVAAVMGRAGAAGVAGAAGAKLSAEQVGAVVDAQFGYFDAIGAIGPEAGPDEKAG